MIGIRSSGTGVLSLNESANFFKSLNLDSLSFLALVTRACSNLVRSREAKVLKAPATSRSTVAVAFGVVSAVTCGEAVRFAEVVAFDATDFESGVAMKLDSVVVGGVAASALIFGLGDGFLSVTDLSGRASWDEIMAGSTGAPLTVDWPVGARRAGGVYLLVLLEVELRGGKSCCLRTPLYLKSIRNVTR
jgi:hypothetical protein